MITLSVTEDQAHMIRYSLGELANKRQEQSIDSNTRETREACRAEAERLRALQRQVADKLPPLFAESL